VLAATPRIGLFDLANAVTTSPHHLRRIFASSTGSTISRYRNPIRVRLALERIAEGEESLALVAAELGFADQAHLTRVVRDHAAEPPSRLRCALRA